MVDKVNIPSYMYVLQYESCCSYIINHRVDKNILLQLSVKYLVRVKVHIRNIIKIVISTCLLNVGISNKLTWVCYVIVRWLSVLKFLLFVVPLCLLSINDFLFSFHVLHSTKHIVKIVELVLFVLIVRSKIFLLQFPIVDRCLSSIRLSM